MRYVGSRATEIEIQATANVFGVDIFTYSGDRWLKYSSSSLILTNEGLYLKHCENNDFEPVVCVQPVD